MDGFYHVCGILLVGWNAKDDIYIVIFRDTKWMQRIKRGGDSFKWLWNISKSMELFPIFRVLLKPP